MRAAGFLYGYPVASPAVQAEVGEAPAALVKQQAVAVLIEYAIVAVAAPLSQVHVLSVY